MKTLTPEQQKAKNLHLVWWQAVEEEINSGSDTARESEQEAFDVLVAHINKHGLHDSQWDPRKGMQ